MDREAQEGIWRDLDILGLFFFLVRYIWRGLLARSPVKRGSSAGYPSATSLIYQVYTPISDS